MAREYYCLVAGLREYALDSENKNFDATTIREEIREQLADKDVGYMELMYTYYDIENIVNLRSGRSQFNTLGNFTREQLAEEIAAPADLPEYLVRIMAAYKDPENTDFDDIDTAMAFERSLFDAYYKQCMASKCKFIREWSQFDMNLRNVCAAYTARRMGMDISKVVVGDNFVSNSLMRSAAADFGLKGELDYIDEVMAAVTNDQNLVEKEQKIDLLRWDHADEMVTFDYFNVNRILSYLVKVNIIHRWVTLDPKTGHEMFEKLIKSLSSKELIENAEKEKQ